MQVEININHEQAEKVSYNRSDYPVYVRKGVLSTYPNYAAISHWHDDIEFIYILSGKMHYSINGKKILMNEGEGVWINARQLHYGFSPDHQECIFICILLHPLLLCSSAYLEQEYVRPVLKNDNFPYLHLHRKNENEQNILTYIQEIYENISHELFALKVQELFFKIWENLYLLSGHTEKSQMPQNQHLTILKNMIHFINLHYSEKISLDDISQAGNIGKTSCCTIFKEYTNQTPNMYLTEYRLKKGLELLLSTDLTISEICFEAGFSGASYFTEAFRKSYGCTPRQYRRHPARGIT